MNYEDHPIASIFPLMSEPEIKGLADNIKANGLKESIWIFEGKILDGRNRYRACLSANSKPRFRSFEGTSLEAIEHVWALNRARRHLTPSQAAIADAKRNKMLDVYAPVKKAAKERKEATYPTKGQKGFKNNVPQQIGEHKKFICECGEVFPTEVWHCPICGGHWAFDKRECPNCHEYKRPTSSQAAEARRHEKETSALRAKTAGTNRTYIDLADKLVEEKPRDK